MVHVHAKDHRIPLLNKSCICLVMDKGDFVAKLAPCNFFKTWARVCRNHVFCAWLRKSGSAVRLTKHIAGMGLSFTDICPF